MVRLRCGLGAFGCAKHRPRLRSDGFRKLWFQFPLAISAWIRWTVDVPQPRARAMLALGPFAPDMLGPLGIRLPLGIKRGYHLHFRTDGNATLTRPIVDVENGYC